MIEIIKYPLTTKFLYRVKENESFESIAKKFGTTPNSIKKDNKIDNLYVGCVLFINTNQTKTYVVKPLDTIDGISKKLNVDKNTLINNNNITKLFIGQKLEY